MPSKCLELIDASIQLTQCYDGESIVVLTRAGHLPALSMSTTVTILQSSPLLYTISTVNVASHLFLRS